MTRTLREGSTGEDVASWRRFLTGQGFPVGEGDRFDAATRAATEAFQARHGLAADGVAGPSTWALARALEAPPGTGSAFLARTAGLSERDREVAVEAALLAGGDPPALRGFVALTLTRAVEGVARTAVLRVAPDYLALGSDEDFVRVPVYPATAQRVADARRCLLPTRRVVDAVYAQAEVRLTPRTITTGPKGTNAAWARHQRMVEEGRAGRPLGALTAGHKKDIVVTPKLAAYARRVAIYGWHKADGRPIQPLSLVHGARYADYSHGARLVSRDVTVDGVAWDLADLYAHPTLSALVSDEGPLRRARYEG